MKSKNIICSLLTLGLVAGGLTGCVTEKENEGKEARLRAQAKITEVEAGKIALAKVPGGTIKEGELEKEKGRLIWSFDVSTLDSKDVTEVQVDAVNGEIVAIDKETSADQEKEAREDKVNEKKEHKKGGKKGEKEDDDDEKGEKNEKN